MNVKLYKLSEDFQSNVGWGYISEYKKISEDFITEFIYQNIKNCQKFL